MMPFACKGLEHRTGLPVLEVHGVTVRYDGVTALEGITFSLQKGDFVALVGPNGAGKSTLFKAIAGLIKPQEGEIKVYGYEPGGHICIAYIPQRSEVDWNFPATVADVVMMGRIAKLGPLLWPRKKDWEVVYKALKVVGLEEMANRPIRELSGGQQQKAFIARALAQEAELMLLDEPFNGIDAPSQAEILQILKELHHREVTIMLSTHDLEMASQHFDLVMLLSRRLLGFGCPEMVFTPQLLRQAYGGHIQFLQTPEGFRIVGDTCCGHGER
jgi:ABC-type Mn2+/Zn2+ transport system ATPase subunit